MWVGLFCLCLSASAAADPIPVTVTGGFFDVPRPVTVGTASVTGTRDFSLEARVISNEGRVDPLDVCNPCAPGSLLSIGASLSGSAFDGVATLDGVTYPDISNLASPASLFFEFFGTIVMPPIQDGSPMISAPFTMTGQFNLPFPDAPVPLSGRGIATLTLRPEFLGGFEPQQWSVDRVRYDFAAPTPVPEPATIALVSGGLLAIVRSRRSALRRKQTLAQGVEERSVVVR
jgi:hypothetical protein